MTYYTYFKNAANDRRLTAADIAAYCLIKADRSESDDKVSVAVARLKRAFSPITDPNKLHNGATPYQALNDALARVIYNVKYKANSYRFTDEESANVHAIATAIGRIV